MDPEKEKEREAVVLDTNIILASILKQGSYTRQVIIYITDILGIEAYTPEKTLQEIEGHLEELAKRKKIQIEELQAAIRILLLDVKIAERDLYKEYLARASDCVRDQADVDFAALALYLSNKFGKVILLTWNKKDYRDNCLKIHRVFVHTPSDLPAFIK